MRDESEKKTLLSEKTYFSFGVVVIIVTIVIWIIRGESHAANDAIEIKYVGERLDKHEFKQNVYEQEHLKFIQSIDQRLSRIEGRLGVK